jgi:osmotically-inducible protein OsmY
MTDKQIQENVLRELDWEPQVKSTDIGVSVKEGVVALSGFVDSYDQRYHAEHAAKRVFGVRAVANDVEVKLPRDGERPDPDLARAAASLLEARSAVVPAQRIKVTVRDGWITLEGEVDWNYQRESTAAAIRQLLGVKGVSNLITVKPHVSAREVKHAIEDALRRSAELDARRINVETTNSTVVLRGSVRAWTEREEAERAAWRAPGVTKVENHIAIAP